jgi:hypothetical protein
MMNKFLPLHIGFIIILSLTACSPGIEPRPDATQQSEATGTPQPTKSAVQIPEKTILGTTQNNLLDNHLVEGSIDLKTASVLDIPVDGVPLWLVSVRFQDGAIFAVILENGNSQAFKVSKSSYEPFAISSVQISTDAPPLLAISDGDVQFILPLADASPLTNPLLINDMVASIAINGDLVLGNSTIQKRLPIDALPDARILMDDNNRLLILTQPTNRYDHGVLGDDMEAAGITLIETKPEIRLVRTISIEAPDVIEGLSPIWADLDQDGVLDIIVTLSNNQSGSRIVAFREDGTMLAESSAIGTGYRWRHQIAFAAFGDKSQSYLASIRTPHIGGVVEFFQFSDGKLETVSEINGFSSHSIGSRNLDSAIAGDFNNDGICELLAPTQNLSSLGVISLGGVITVLPLDGVLTSNLSTISVNGSIIVGAGTQGNLRIWLK